ncbi:NAD-dependent epimerase/dehydratase family protein [Mycobacterium sp. MYCO198283]|uniref:NAD-dependent epimerase/dehydratase family protein n=1 Tax=Mycobacterium sp. MYCO198283 TaxID=2883505 RepID=UPI001E3F5308|nr:NAD-dependent epimerase/dehydratase family protein [Mycobacterium sp. MYCO198283]MCG5433282.1 NAD-dependent epimerase/dehydratase family protein [Mycobacterium sp. MYCO198283]
MRIVITGASGNVGTALLRRLVNSGQHHELVGVVRRPPEPVDVYADVQWHSQDLSEPDTADRLTEIFAGADAVVHLVWGFQPTHDRDYLHRVDVGGTTAVLDAAHRAKVGHLTHMSSVGAYAAGRYGQRVDESWPATGITTSWYSRHKAEAEALLDDYERTHGSDGVPIARFRPGFILQRAAASGLLRYTLPAYVPMGIVPLLPVLPIDRKLCLPLIHTDDVADAIARAVERGATGPFNLAAEPPMSRADIAEVLGARPIHVPSGVLGTLVDLSWRARLQHLDRGWLDLSFTVPLLNCDRARRELGWEPRYSSKEAFADFLAGVSERAHTASAPLRARSMLDLLRKDVTEGLISSRRLP